MFSEESRNILSTNQDQIDTIAGKIEKELKNRVFYEFTRKVSTVDVSKLQVYKVFARKGRKWYSHDLTRTGDGQVRIGENDEIERNARLVEKSMKKCSRKYQKQISKTEYFIETGNRFTASDIKSQPTFNLIVCTSSWSGLLGIARRNVKILESRHPRLNISIRTRRTRVHTYSTRKFNRICAHPRYRVHRSVNTALTTIRVVRGTRKASRRAHRSHGEPRASN